MFSYVFIAQYFPVNPLRFHALEVCSGRYHEIVSILDDFYDVD